MKPPAIVMFLIELTEIVQATGRQMEAEGSDQAPYASASATHRVSQPDQYQYPADNLDDDGDPSRQRRSGYMPDVVEILRRPARTEYEQFLIAEPDESARPLASARADR